MQTDTRRIDQPISCSLDAGAMAGRMDDWQALLALVIDRTPVGDGISLSFSPEPGVAAEVARLAVAEQACCAFFDFMVRVSGGELHLEVRGPQEAQEIISVLFGGCRRERIGAAKEGDVMTSPARPTAPRPETDPDVRETEPEGDSSSG